MALLKIKDFDPNYRDTFGGHDLKDLEVYSDVNNEKIGTVNDLLVDQQGHFRYFVLDLGFWGFGKKVLLPVGRSQVDSEGRFIRALGFTKNQAENLPEFSEKLKIDHDYEERVRGNYRTPTDAPMSQQMRSVESSAPLEGRQAQPNMNTPGAAPMPAQGGYMGQQPYPQGGQPPMPTQGGQVPASAMGQPPMPAQGGYSSTSPSVYDYQQEPQLYGMTDQHHSVLKRYEQRLISKKMGQ